MIFFCIFQTLNAFSCDLLVFAINVFKTNIFAFIRTLFLTPTFFLANTSNRFFAHFLCFFSPWLSGFLDYLGLQTALWEILRILCENLWRNKLPKLTTLSPIFQLLHSALGDLLGSTLKKWLVLSCEANFFQDGFDFSWVCRIEVVGSKSKLVKFPGIV